MSTESLGVYICSARVYTRSLYQQSTCHVSTRGFCIYSALVTCLQEESVSAPHVCLVTCLRTWLYQESVSAAHVGGPVALARGGVPAQPRPALPHLAPPVAAVQVGRAPRPARRGGGTPGPGGGAAAGAGAGAGRGEVAVTAGTLHRARPGGHRLKHSGFSLHRADAILYEN